MPNIKSAKKRVLVNAKKTEQNKAIRSAVRTEIKKIDLLIKENKLEEAKAALSNAFSVIDSACGKNILHANNASNKKAKLAKKVDAALAANVVAEPVAPAIEEAPVVEETPVVEEAKPVKKTTKKAAAKKEDATEEPAKKTTTRKPRAKKAETTETAE